MPRHTDPRPETGLKKPQPAIPAESPARLADAEGRLKKQDLKKPDQKKADAKVDQAAQDSFPASDPPSFNRGHSGRPDADRDATDVEGVRPPLPN